MKISYQSASDLPSEMVQELKSANFADEAEIVFAKWENLGGYVEPRSRSTVWMEV